MDHYTHHHFVKSKIWLVLTIIVFAIFFIMTQALYTKSGQKNEIDIKPLLASYSIPIVLSTIALILFHFQFHRLGALFGVLVGFNLIGNIALTDIIISSTETIMTLFKPIFSLLPLLNSALGAAQIEFIQLITNIVQVLYGVFLICINLPVLFKKSKSVFNHI